ncbi:hypothetical protein [Novosphingobium sp. 9]|nr:hypothetical protein [Novosphingobium sp. 9]
MPAFAIGLYLGGAAVMLAAAGGSRHNRVLSALVWPTFPLWPL